MNILQRERFLSLPFSGPSIRLIIGQRERWRTLFWLMLLLIGIPVGLIGYLTVLLWAYGVTG